MINDIRFDLTSAAETRPHERPRDSPCVTRDRSHPGSAAETSRMTVASGRKRLPIVDKMYRATLSGDHAPESLSGTAIGD